MKSRRVFAFSILLAFVYCYTFDACSSVARGDEIKPPPSVTQPQTPPVEVPPVIAPPVPVKPDADEPVAPTPDTLTKPFAIVATMRGAVLGDLIARPDVGHLLELTTDGLPADAGPVFWTYSEVIPDRSERDGGKWVGLSFPPEVSGKAYLIQAAVNGPEGSPPLVAMRWLVVSGHAPQPPPVVAPIDPSKPPVVVDPANPSTVTAVVYVYEKDDGMPPPGVLSGLNRLNRERKIPATDIDDDVTNGNGDTPEQYKSAISAARTKGMPALVVMHGTTPEVWHDVNTELDVLGAVK